MSKYPAYLWYIGDFKTGTKYFNFMQRAIYRELLDAQWDDGFIPDDAEALAQMVGLCQDEFDKHWQKVREKFEEVEPGILKNARMERERKILLDKSKKAAKSASARWGKSISNSENMQKESESNANEMRTHCEGNASRVEIEDEIEIENEDTGKEGVQGEGNHLADLSADANDLLHSMINFFGIREHIDNLKYRLVYKFLENMTAWGEFDSARQQIIAYMQFKATASEKPHGVENFLGDYEKRYHNGAWFQTDWTKKLSNNGTNQRTGTAKVRYGEKFTGFGSFEKS